MLRGGEGEDPRLTNLHLPDGGRQGVWHMPHAAHTHPHTQTHIHESVVIHLAFPLAGVQKLLS